VNFGRSIRRFTRLFFHSNQPNEVVRLHLGSGADYWQGYVNVDSGADADCDLRLDFTKIRDVYAEGSVSEVAMIHSLSYLRLWQAREMLSDVYDLLQPTGRMIIELPDILKCAEYALTHHSDLKEYLEAIRGVYAFGMDQIERREIFTPYAFGWSSEHLKCELEQVGFRQVTVCDPQTHGCRLWRDTRLEAVK